MANPGLDGYAVLKPQINGKQRKTQKDDTVLKNY